MHAHSATGMQCQFTRFWSSTTKFTCMVPRSIWSRGHFKVSDQSVCFCFFNEVRPFKSNLPFIQNHKSVFSSADPRVKVRNLYIVFKLLSLLLRLNFWLYIIANLVLLNCSFFISINEFSSLMAAITCLVGLHYGHILVHCKVICFFFFLARRGCKPMNCFYL